MLPLLKGSDSAVAAQAGYLLTLLDEPQGLPVLIHYYEQRPGDERYRRLVYRAIAHLDAAEHVPLLKRIYAEIQRDPDPEASIKEFYWTVRGMTGPEALALRKQIRDEQGAATLR